VKVFVDTAGLASNGAALSGEGAPQVAAPPVAGAFDPVTQSLGASLGTRAVSLSMLLAHGSAVRAVGGMAVTATAGGFHTADADNAAVLGGQGPSSRMASMVAPAMQPPPPQLPAVPTMTAPPAMPGDVFSQAVHAGPGGGPWRANAQLLRSQVVAALREQADEVIRSGTAIDANWQDGGDQRAGANTVGHGDWLHQIADHTNALAGAFDDAADHLDRARQATPPPEDFARARQNFLNAQAAGDPVAAAQAAADYSGLNTRATDAMFGYHGNAAATTTALNTPLTPAPAISNGGDTAPGPDDQIVGPPDPRKPKYQLVDNGSGGPQPPGPAPQIGPFPVPPQVAATAPAGPPPAGPPPPGDPNSFVSQWQQALTAPPAAPPPANPAPMPSWPGLPQMRAAPPPPDPGPMPTEANPSPGTLLGATGAGCLSGGATGGLVGAPIPIAEGVTIPGGCVGGALIAGGGYLGGIWLDNMFHGLG
jgi:hypothetical protein